MNIFVKMSMISTAFVANLLTTFREQLALKWKNESRDFAEKVKTTSIRQKNQFPSTITKQKFFLKCFGAISNIYGKLYICNNFITYQKS